MEIRVVRFNIKQFIEDYVFCVETKDFVGKKELLSRYNNIFLSSNSLVKVAMQTYLLNSSVAKDYAELQGLATRRIIF